MYFHLNRQGISSTPAPTPANTRHNRKVWNHCDAYPKKHSSTHDPELVLELGCTTDDLIAILSCRFLYLYKKRKNPAMFQHDSAIFSFYLGKCKSADGEEILRIVAGTCRD